MMYLKKLTSLAGVSGFEDAVRDYILEQARALADEVHVDALGNVIAIRHGTDPDPVRVLVDAHMDEIGFMIRSVEDTGLLRFACIGGMDARILYSQRVRIGDKAVPGVIGCPAIHLMSKDEMEKPPKVDDLLIDIGVKDRDDALQYVQPGNTAVFDSDYVEFGEGMIKARALDDRAGCALLLGALHHRYPCTLAAVFSVQEEIGLKGAAAAARRVDPDLAIILEGTTCADMHGVKDHLRVTRLGHGPAVSMMDASAISDPTLRDFILRTATAGGIAHQHRAGTFGGTNAGAIQLAADGVRVANINVPCRYIHSPICTMNRGDFEGAAALLQLVLQDIHTLGKKERTHEQH